MQVQMSFDVHSSTTISIVTHLRHVVVFSPPLSSFAGGMLLTLPFFQLSPTLPRTPEGTHADLDDVPASAVLQRSLGHSIGDRNRVKEGEVCLDQSGDVAGVCSDWLHVD
jgi:hypothetical protein